MFQFIPEVFFPLGILFKIFGSERCSPINLEYSPGNPRIDKGFQVRGREVNDGKITRSL